MGSNFGMIFNLWMQFLLYYILCVYWDTQDLFILICFKGIFTVIIFWKGSLLLWLYYGIGLDISVTRYKFIIVQKWFLNNLWRKPHTYMFILKYQYLVFHVFQIYFVFLHLWSMSYDCHLRLTFTTIYTTKLVLDYFSFYVEVFY